MAAAVYPCPRCKRRRPLVSCPVPFGGPLGERPGFLCVECATRERPQKPKVIEKTT